MLVRNNHIPKGAGNQLRWNLVLKMLSENNQHCICCKQLSPGLLKKMLPQNWRTVINFSSRTWR
jgi:hypothetical protein